MKRRISILLFVLLVPIASHALWDYLETRRLFTAIDELRQRGEPVSRDALGRWKRPENEEERSAARVYTAAAALAFRDWTLRRTDNMPITTRMNAAIGDIETAIRQGTIDTTAVDRLRAVRDEYADALELADRAAPLAFSTFPYQGFEDYSRTYSLENLAWACSARTLVLASEGNDDAAGRSLWSCLRLHRATARWVYSVNALLLELRGVLERTRPSPQTLAQLQDAFAGRERPDMIERDIRERRAAIIEASLAELYGPATNPLIPSAHVVWTWRPSLPGRPWVVHGIVASLRRQQEVIDLTTKPWPDKLSALLTFARTHPPPDNPPRGRLDAGYYGRHLPNMAADSAVSAGRTLAHLRSARVIVAIERFRREHDGRPPASLSELVPTYLAELPQDPFTGKPLIFVSDTSRLAVYSAGQDGKDDGGDVEPLTGMAALRRKDVGLGIRLQGDSK